MPLTELLETENRMDKLGWGTATTTTSDKINHVTNGWIKRNITDGWK